jgi:hypothetical protein
LRAGLALLLGLSALHAGRPAEAHVDPALTREIEAVLRGVEAVYDRNDSPAYFDTFWAPGDNLAYMSEQFFPVFYGRRAVEAYFKPPEGRNMYAWRTRLSSVQAMYLAPDVAIATYQARFDMHAYTRTPLGGWTRKVGIFERTPAGWRYLAELEAPMSLISQARRVHEEALAADFLAFSRRQNPGYDAQVAKDRKIQARRGDGTPWVTAGENTPTGYPRTEPSAQQARPSGP